MASIVERLAEVDCCLDECLAFLDFFSVCRITALCRNDSVRSKAMSPSLWRHLYLTRHGGAGSNVAEMETSTVQWRNRFKLIHGHRSPIFEPASSWPINARAGHSATVLGSSAEADVLIVGGISSNGTASTADVLYKSSIRGEGEMYKVWRGVWKEPTPPSASGWLHSCSLLQKPESDGILVLIGGGNRGACIAEVLVSWSAENWGVRGGALSYPLASAHPRRFSSWDELQMSGATRERVGWCGHTANVLPGGDSILVFGGIGLDDRATNTLALLEAEGGKSGSFDLISSPSGTPPSPRFCHSSSLLPRGPGLVVFGGWLGDFESHETANDLHHLDLSTRTWSEISTLGVPPAPRCQAVCWLLHDDLLMIYGGASHSLNEDGSAPEFYGDLVKDHDDACILDLSTRTWVAELSTRFAPQRGGCNAVWEQGGYLHISGGMHSDSGTNKATFHKLVSRCCLSLESR